MFGTYAVRFPPLLLLTEWLSSTLGSKLKAWYEKKVEILILMITNWKREF